MISDATKNKISALVRRYADARVQGELAYDKDAGRATLRRHDEHAKKALDDLDVVLAGLCDVSSLDESLKLQSHYAKLLNMHDGGERMTFASSREWFARLGEVS